MEINFPNPGSNLLLDDAGPKVPKDVEERTGAIWSVLAQLQADFRLIAERARRVVLPLRSRPCCCGDFQQQS
ncbi:unnamed protein product [Nezara viridula]|uniref:Uncharacterized protein n=1 Tax=Nezara viridula TaxID=85310 RepID=A0A9P0MPV8_NEZVI|nr:unnamed protein product [Nezara viridula]